MFNSLFLRAFRFYPDGDNGEDKGVTPTSEGESGSKEDANKNVVSTVETTKAFAARLASARKADRLKIAKENGYETYAEFQSAMQLAKIQKDTSVDITDPEVKKAISILSANNEDGDRVAEMESELEAYKAAETARWEKEQLSALKKNYGIDISSIDNLDQAVKDKIAKGIDPVDAYYLVHHPAPKKEETKTKPDNKEHLLPEANGGTDENKVVIPADKMKIYREMNPDLTDEQIIEGIKQLRKK